MAPMFETLAGELIFVFFTHSVFNADLLVDSMPVIVSKGAALRYCKGCYWSEFPLLNCVYSSNGIYLTTLPIINKVAEKQSYKATRARAVWMAANWTKCLASRDCRAVFGYHHGIHTVEYGSISEQAKKWEVTPRH